MRPMDVALRESGRAVLLTGNQAIARGAVEAGVDFCAAYPGSPSSEILETLAALAADFGHYAEWSANEKVALEAATAASFAGLRALAAMKPNGLNVALDFLMHLCMTGSRGGLVLVVCDDPHGHSSTNEQDSRPLVRAADLPLLEPSGFDEAREMTSWAFELSERIGHPCTVRSVTRLSHARGNVTLGAVGARSRNARFERDRSFICMPPAHRGLHSRMALAREIFEECRFNSYEGPENPDLVIVACGTGVAYAREVIRSAGLDSRVALLKIGTTWPLPERFILSRLAGRRAVLFIEEVESFLEDEILALMASRGLAGGLRFYGKRSGHVKGPAGPGIGELNVDVVEKAVYEVLALPEGDGANATVPGSFGGEPPAVEAPAVAEETTLQLPPRELAFCAGCPHRASYWVLNAALQVDGRDGFVVGDIGCYTLGAFRTGYNLLRTVHCMGGGMGLAAGFGQLSRFGFDQPVVAVIGDSTFFHAGIPALISARYNNADLLCVVLDNQATAMTGFQPHPGTGITALGSSAPAVSIEGLCRGLGIPCEAADPFKLEESTEVVVRLLREPGLKVLVFRQPCALVLGKDAVHPPYHVDPAACIGLDCGCAAFCTRVFSCPANVWDCGTGKARIDELICTGCGVCADLCPVGAIKPGEEARSIAG